MQGHWENARQSRSWEQGPLIMRLGAPVHTLARIPCLMPPLGPALFPAGGLTPPRSGRCKLERNKGHGLSGGGAHGDPARRGWLVVPDAVLGPWPEWTIHRWYGGCWMEERGAGGHDADSSISFQVWTSQGVGLDVSDCAPSLPFHRPPRSLRPSRLRQAQPRALSVHATSNADGVRLNQEATQ